mgnify:CR=1 FL=1
MGKKISRIEKSELSIKTLLAMTIADVDNFLLQNEEQTEDLNKTFSVEEIRNQLSNTLKKVVKVLEESGIDVDKSIKSKNINF